MPGVFIGLSPTRDFVFVRSERSYQCRLGGDVRYLLSDRGEGGEADQSKQESVFHEFDRIEHLGRCVGGLFQSVGIGPLDRRVAFGNNASAVLDPDRLATMRAGSAQAMALDAVAAQR